MALAHCSCHNIAADSAFLLFVEDTKRLRRNFAAALDGEKLAPIPTFSFWLRPEFAARSAPETVFSFPPLTTLLLALKTEVQTIISTPDFARHLANATFPAQ